MNDSLTGKQIVLSGLTAADFTGSEIYSRIHSSNANSHLRGCTLTPTSGDITKLVLRVSHNTSDKSLTRSVMALEFEIQRRALGATGQYDQPTGVTTVGTIALRVDVPPTLSVTEYNTMAARLIGLLTENNGALLVSCFNRET